MPDEKITCIILSYKREPNIRVIIDAIRAQTIPSLIWIWDNNNSLDPGLADKYPGLVLIRSTENFICRPRFILPGLVKTPFIFNFDDDHTILDRKLFERLIDLSGQYPRTFFGWPGRKEYGKFAGPESLHNRFIDFLNTGISFYPTELCNKFLMNPFINESTILRFTETEYKYGDDHWISAQLPQKLIPDFLEPACPQMSDHGIGISLDQNHIKVRSELSRRLFNL